LILTRNLNLKLDSGFLPAPSLLFTGVKNVHFGLLLQSLSRLWSGATSENSTYFGSSNKCPMCAPDVV